MVRAGHILTEFGIQSRVVNHYRSHQDELTRWVYLKFFMNLLFLDNRADGRGDVRRYLGSTVS